MYPSYWEWHGAALLPLLVFEKSGDAWRGVDDWSFLPVFAVRATAGVMLGRELPSTAARAMRSE